MGGEAREVSRFVPSAAGRALSADWGGPGRSLRRPGEAGGSPRRRHSLSASPFPPDLPLERLYPVRLLCARAELLARTGGALEPPPLQPAPSCPQPSAPFLRGGRPRADQVVLLANRASGIGCGVPLWLATGFSPCSTLLPLVTCHRLFPRGAGSPRFACQQ